MLKLYNTLTGQKDSFEPLEPGTVRMYVCGVTVYDECHIGHARSALVFDVIRNYLQFSGYAVTFVKIFTDVDDKIINRASQEGCSWLEVVDRYLQAYERDMGRLGIRPADIEPKATEHIPDIIQLIDRLLAKGYAYRLNGDVYYQVEAYPAYGRLSKRKAEDLLAGARVEVDERKRSPMDFALWKSSKPGEPYWESPWGRGRPGWHIECSAMSIRHLGETFDIHGGGMDLIFPHHENEIAQSCAATGKEFARYWVHNGFVQINQEKMSKSLGNFFTIREIFEKWRKHWREASPEEDPLTAEVLRYFLLATHYRSPLDFSDQGLEEARRALNGFYGLFQRLGESSLNVGPADGLLSPLLDRVEESFRRAMDDDFNTPVAIAEFQGLRGELNKLLETGLSRTACEKACETFRRVGLVLGIFQLPAQDWQFNLSMGAAQRVASDIAAGLSDAAIEDLIRQRNEARKKKDFAKADAIRAELAAQGIIIEDRPDGTSRWKR
jgi:cysteinyl-tRNA synthetase